MTISDYYCPHCGFGVEDLYFEDHDQEEEYEVECRFCRKTFVVSYYYVPVFAVSSREHLDIDSDDAGRHPSS